MKKQSAYSLFLVVVQNARIDIKITKNVTCFIRKNKNSRGTENKYNPILYVNSKIYHQKMQMVTFKMTKKTENKENCANLLKNK